jgi:hypothetical protein
LKRSSISETGQEAVQVPQEKQRLKKLAPGRDATSYLKSLSSSVMTMSATVFLQKV